MSTTGIRNFVIIAHIDHGKSTLADRLLEITKSVAPAKMRPQYLDSLSLERERGLTIKMAPATMEYAYEGRRYSLNLIDTPGHMDFAYEVERSLAAVEGAVLLVDGSQGIQAQTLSVLSQAIKAGLTVIPVLNKIDLPEAQTKKTALAEELMDLLKSSGVKLVVAAPLAVSAKTGQGIEELLKLIITKVPPPSGRRDGILKALLFDSWLDAYQGVIATVRIMDGSLTRKSRLKLVHDGMTIKPVEIGLFKPERIKTNHLRTGQIGYISTGIKDITKIRIGETIASDPLPANFRPLKGYDQPQAMVFANVFPVAEQTFEVLKKGINSLKLNDATILRELINQPVLGQGFRIGALGMLHLEVIVERLREEYGVEVVLTPPSVSYRVLMTSQKLLLVRSASELPDPPAIKTIREPWVSLKILSIHQYTNSIFKLVKEARGRYLETTTLSSHSSVFTFEAPLAEIIEDFIDKLKGGTQGFASMSYDLVDWREADVVKIDFLIAGELFPAFSRLVAREKAERVARAMLLRFKHTLPRQLFSQSLQAAIGGKIIAREDIPALRKDVTGHLYGGDYSRKRKLLEKQRRGKRRLKSRGRVVIDSRTALEILRSR